MNPTGLLIALLFVAGRLSSLAQSPEELNEGSQVSYDPATGSYTLSWWGRPENRYFIQTSEDLIHWTWLSDPEQPASARILRRHFQTNAERLFFRLVFTAISPQDGDTDDDGMPDVWEAAHGLNPFVDDAAGDPDDDGLTNLTEFRAGTSPIQADSDQDGTPDPDEDGDGDGLSNLAEQVHGNDPLDADTDDDGMPDGWEVAHELNPLVDDASAQGDDGDGLTNLTEFRAGTDPRLLDSDEDDIWDQFEDPDGDGLDNLSEQQLGTHPGKEDTDDDFLRDAEDSLPTDPSNGLRDSDGDGLPDGWELRMGLNPNDPTDGQPSQSDLDQEVEFAWSEHPGQGVPRLPSLDVDADGMDDEWEIGHGLAPSNPDDARWDDDGDHLSNLQEYWNGSDPQCPAQPASYKLVLTDLAADSSYSKRISVTRRLVLGRRAGEEDLEWAIRAWDASRATTLLKPPAGKAFSFWRRSENGVLLAWMGDAGNPNPNAVLYGPPGSMNPLAPMPSGDVFISPNGEFVAGGNRRWQGTQSIVLPFSASAKAVNGVGAVIAYGSPDGFVYREGLPLTTLAGFNPVAINETGQVLGTQGSPATFRVWDGSLHDTGFTVQDSSSNGSVAKLCEDGSVTIVHYDPAANTATAYRYEADGPQQTTLFAAPPGFKPVRAVYLQLANAVAPGGAFLSAWNQQLLAAGRSPQSIVAAHGAVDLPYQVPGYSPLAAIVYYEALLESGIAIGWVTGSAPSVIALAVPTPADSDGDGLPDDWETFWGFDPQNSSDAGTDLDQDGASNEDEFVAFTNPTRPPSYDLDGDGLLNGIDISLGGLSPDDRDSDGDGLSDGEEVGIYFTRPDLADSDGDGLSDGDEINRQGTDPHRADTDGDGVNDLLETQGRSNPTDAASKPDSSPESKPVDVSWSLQIRQGTAGWETTLGEGSTPEEPIVTGWETYSSTSDASGEKAMVTPDTPSFTLQDTIQKVFASVSGEYGRFKNPAARGPVGVWYDTRQTSWSATAQATELSDVCAGEASAALVRVALPRAADQDLTLNFLRIRRDDPTDPNLDEAPEIEVVQLQVKAGDRLSQRLESGKDDLRPRFAPGHAESIELLAVDIYADDGKVHWGFDPPEPDDEDQREYWASVIKDDPSGNQVVNVSYGDDQTAAKFEWRIVSGQVNFTVTQGPLSNGKAKLDIKETGYEGDVVFEGEAQLVWKDTGVKAYSLRVMILPRQEVPIGIYTLQDPPSAATHLPGNVPSPGAISDACNDVFHQAGVHFTPHATSGARQYGYDAIAFRSDLEQEFGFFGFVEGSDRVRAEDGHVTPDENEALFYSVPPTLPGKPTYDAKAKTLFENHPSNGKIGLAIVNRSAIPYGDPGPPYVRGGSSGWVGFENVVEPSHLCLVVAHEVGHQLRLSTAEGGENGHDDPPYGAQVTTDRPLGVEPTKPGPAYGGTEHKDEPEHAVMASGETLAGDRLPWLFGRWMRHEDWKKANTLATQYASQ